MAYRRIAYAALLGGAVLFQIVFRFYLSTFTLALVLLLLLSVLLSLPSVLGCTLLLTSAAPTVVQGEDAVFQVRLPHPPAPAPASGPSPLEQPAHRRGRAGAVGARAHRTGRSAHSGAGHPTAAG